MKIRDRVVGLAAAGAVVVAPGTSGDSPEPARRVGRAAVLQHRDRRRLRSSRRRAGRPAEWPEGMGIAVSGMAWGSPGIEYGDGRQVVGGILFGAEGNTEVCAVSLAEADMFYEVSAIIRASVLESVERQLQRANVRSITVFRVKGYGEYKNFFTADWMKPFVRIDVLTTRGREVADVVADAAHTGQPGDGIVWINPLGDVIGIRERRTLRDDEE